ncbi:MAG: cupin domain-containing protein [Planctomycetota bacterium]
MTTPAGLHRIDELPLDHPASGAARRRVIGARCMVSHLVLEPGFEVARHAHENEQVSMVLDGRIRFELGEPGAPEHGVIEAGPGDVVMLPPNLPHSAVVIKRCTLIDIFSPPSEATGIDAPSS